MEICKRNTYTESKSTKHNLEICQTDLSHSNRFKNIGVNNPEHGE